ncbi:MAG: DUF2922 domain-containing protein [Thermoanaerobacterales bacterium]|jgi:hypothetical protein|nr:DUF2922 domain-containing protein [Thermoanaerobacterales bacterium]
MEKTLEMIFLNAAGKNSRISVSDPKEDITREDVESAMNTIVSSNIFDTTGGELIKAVSARIITREVVEIVPKEE